MPSTTQFPTCQTFKRTLHSAQGSRELTPRKRPSKRVLKHAQKKGGLEYTKCRRNLLHVAVHSPRGRRQPAVELRPSRLGPGIRAVGGGRGGPHGQGHVVAVLAGLAVG